MINIDLSNAIKEKDILSYQKKVNLINKMIIDKTGEGNDFLGWVDWPTNYPKDEVSNIIRVAHKIRKNYDVLLVIGIGGSYLGARSAIEALKGLRYKDDIEIIFFGQTFSGTYTKQVLDYLKDKRFAINVISKSGTTTESSIAFRLAKALLEKKVGKKEARKAIIATTDIEKGALLQLSTNESYIKYVLPRDIGGRYSVFTPVGLFPMAVAGIDVLKFLEGAKKAQKEFANPDLKKNICYRYAVTRDFMYNHKKSVEMYVTYEPHMSQISEWLKQLFGESEGKNKLGLFPASATFSTDLHSLGQFVQDGTPLLFETILNVQKPLCDVKIPHDNKNLDGLNYLEGKTMAYVNDKAYKGTLSAHVNEGNVPCISINISEMNEANLGYLLYLFMRACAMSAYLLNINPFNQPGVEIYKKNMFHLLGKKGY